MTREPRWAIVFLSVTAVGVACSVDDERDRADGQPTSATSMAAQGHTLNVEELQRVLGQQGAADGGEWKVTVPQNDLGVVVDGFRIVPPMGLGSWAAFTPTADGAAVMGDLVLQEDEVGSVQLVLLEQGLTMTALHKHFLRETPRVAFMHFAGRGSEAALGAAVRAVFDKVAELRGGDPSAAPASEVQNSLDIDRIAEILGFGGALNGGVYRVTIGRPDVSLKDHGATVSTFGGFNTWAAFQGTPERAAVAGDFAMLPDEVDGVLRALADHGIEVVVLHNHMVHEEPRILFLHYWGVGPAEQLARGLRAGLDRTGT